jgi:hypothetical protein
MRGSPPVSPLALRAQEELQGLRREGSARRLWCSRHTVLLNALGLEPGTVSFVVDRNPHKHGRYLPGVRVPIRPPEALIEDQPDYVLLLVWNLADEILAQQSEYRARGGRFILPLPEVRIV